MYVGSVREAFTLSYSCLGGRGEEGEKRGRRRKGRIGGRRRERIGR